MRPRALLIVLALFVLSTAIMMFGPYRELSSRLTPDKPFDEVAAVSSDEAAVRLGRLGDEGRALYHQHFWWDLVFILANASAIGIVMLVALPRAGVARRYVTALLLFPVVWALADIVENVAVAQLLASWETPLASWVVVGRSATTAKMILGVASLLVAVASLVGWGARALRASRGR